MLAAWSRLGTWFAVRMMVENMHVAGCVALAGMIWSPILAGSAGPGREAVEQSVAGTQATAAGEKSRTLAIDQENAIALLKDTAESLSRSSLAEPDQGTAYVLRAKIADVLWQFDEEAARKIVRRAFEEALGSEKEGKQGESGLPDATKQRSEGRDEVLPAILRLVAMHSRETAEAWQKEIREALGSKASPLSSGIAEPELLAAFALDLADADPAEARRLALLSLAGTHVPSGFGVLLTRLGDRSAEAEQALFRAAVEALVRGGYSGDSRTLLTLANHAFSFGTSPNMRIDSDLRQLFLDFLARAVVALASKWSEIQAAGGHALPSPEYNLLLFLMTRGLPILERNTPESFQSLRAQILGIVTSLGLEQQQSLNDSVSDAQLIGTPQHLGPNLDSLLRQADQIADSKRRDERLRLLSLSQLSRQDVSGALKAAARISNKELREETEDDAHLISFALSLRRGLVEEAKVEATRVVNRLRRAAMLLDLAEYLSLRPAGSAGVADLLAEARFLAGAAEDGVEKLSVLLKAMSFYSRLDRIVGFEVLQDAVKTAADLRRHPMPASNEGGVQINITIVVDSKAISTGEHRTESSIDFHEIQALARLDYTRVVLLGKSIPGTLMQAKFLLAAASAILFTEPGSKVDDPPRPRVPAGM